ncbi:MAG: NUDIX hydrolase, partial [Clostridia bacterium]|nr:NUDIX hydrolase [Clostridia bacterium]
MKTLRQQIEAFCPFNEQEENDRRLILQYMDTFPDLLTRENEMAHFTASCWIANHDQSKVLMAYHNLYRSWAWLGGHADGEEDLLQVALREANEESGITGIRPQTKDIFSLEILGVDAHRKRGRHVSSHLHLNVTYFFYADETLPIRAKPDENSAVRWIETGHVLDE